MGNIRVRTAVFAFSRYRRIVQSAFLFFSSFSSYQMQMNRANEMNLAGLLCSAQTKHLHFLQYSVVPSAAQGSCARVLTQSCVASGSVTGAAVCGREANDLCDVVSFSSKRPRRGCGDRVNAY